jgi:hypothetical protein
MGLRPQALGPAHQRLSQVPWALPVLRVRQVRRDLRERQALLDLPDLPDLRGRLALLARPELLVSLGLQGQRVQPEPQVLWVPRGLPVQPGLRELRELREPREPRERLAQLGQQARA